MIDAWIDRMAQATGRGVRAAVLDTGVDAQHPWVGGRVDHYHVATPSPSKPGEPIDPGSLRVEPCGSDAAGDPVGHGTAVASRLRRVAPDCHIVSVRVLGRGGAGSAAALTAALGWLATQDVQVVNLSLSTPRIDWGLRMSHEIDTLVAQGVVVAASAGPGPIATDFPARLGAVIGVDAQRPADGLLASLDHAIDFKAPGVDVPAAWRSGQTRLAIGSSYACPVVTGLTARLLEAEPTLRPYEVRAALRRLALNRTAERRFAWVETLLAQDQHEPGADPPGAPRA
ncbi:MAG: S8 family serine peptidase [Planctomycetota bacterium]